MHVVISGASGLVGAALRAALAREGHHVRRLARGAISAGEVVGWDPEAGRIDAPALEGVDAVVHLAGEGIGARRWSDDQKRRIEQSRVRGTAALAAALASRQRKPSVLVSASAVGWYGDRGDEVLTERSTPGDDFLARVCRAWEEETRPAADAGIRTVCIRSGIVLARHGGALARMLTPFRLGAGGRTGTGGQWMSWITLDDEVRAIVHALTRPDLAGPVNLTAPEPVPNAVFAKELGRVLRRPALLPTPLPVLKAVYGGELVDALLLASQRVHPAALTASGFVFRSPRLEPALRAVLGG